MRIHQAVAIALLLPGALSAQRRMGGRVGGRPGGPTALPPTAPVVAREMSYVPRPYSAESYMFINYVQQPSAATNALTNYGTLSAGTRLDYRLGTHMSITGDVTTSLYGGPGTTASFELGTRFRPIPAMSESRVHPYVDARLGYVYSYESYMMTADPTAVNPLTIPRSRAGRGTGAIAGSGADFAVTRSVALQAGFWGMRTKLHAMNIVGPAGRPGDYQTYWMTSYRFALGFRWNPMRAVPKYDDPIER
jgi:hypothetical protein